MEYWHVFFRTWPIYLFSHCSASYQLRKKMEDLEICLIVLIIAVLLARVVMVICFLQLLKKKEEPPIDADDYIFYMRQVVVSPDTLAVSPATPAVSPATLAGQLSPNTGLPSQLGVKLAPVSTSLRPCFAMFKNLPAPPRRSSYQALSLIHI